MPSIEEFAEQHGITVDELLEIVNNTVPLNDLKNKITEIQEFRTAANNREKWLIAEAIHEHGMAISQLAQILGTSRQNTHAKWNSVPRNKGPLPEWPTLNEETKEGKEVHVQVLGAENWTGFLESAGDVMTPEQLRKFRKTHAFEQYELYSLPEVADDILSLLEELVEGYLIYHAITKQQQEQEQQQQYEQEQQVAHDTDDED